MSKYTKISKNIHEVVIDNPETPGGEIKWINITSANKTEIEFLRKNYNFSLKNLMASSAKATSQRTTVEINENYVFVILHFPRLKNDTIFAEEIDFFISDKFVVTLHDNNLKPLNDFFSLCKKDDKSLISYHFESTAALLYEIIDKLMVDCFKLIDFNSIKINEVEDVIYNQESKTAVSRILSLRRNMINTRKILQNHKNIIKKLLNTETGIVVSGEIKKYYLQLLETSKRVWESLDNQKEMIEALHDTNESFLNYQISDIMKTLTIFSVIVFPLTLFAAIFGMNTLKGMPLVETENGFWIIVAVMFIGCFGMLLFFKKKKWL